MSARNVQFLRVNTFFSIIFGSVISCASGLVNVTPHDLLGASWYGWPIAWRFVIVYPGSPVTYNWLNLILDIAIWSIVWFLLLSLASIWRKAK
jgi:hypothetical protein